MYTSSNLRKHTSTNPLQQLLLQRFHTCVASLLSTIQPTHILDAGCGEGFAMRELWHEQRQPVVGLDGSHHALQMARHLNGHHSFAAADLLALPFPDRSFDLVVCMEVLEHLSQPARGLTELCRVSSRHLLLTVPNEPLFRGANFLRGKNVLALGNDPGHLNHWSAQGFLRFIKPYCRVIAFRTSFPWTIALCQVA
jgi:2-polyprenyl-3-methyl-5-hydroxy-6-metoxy-1,4-benzoquinol methylase